jgi:hypothetical protein
VVLVCGWAGGEHCTLHASYAHDNALPCPAGGTPPRPLPKPFGTLPWEAGRGTATRLAPKFHRGVEILCVKKTFYRVCSQLLYDTKPGISTNFSQLKISIKFLLAEHRRLCRTNITVRRKGTVWKPRSRDYSVVVRGFGQNDVRAGDKGPARGVRARQDRLHHAADDRATAHRPGFSCLRCMRSPREVAVDLQPHGLRQLCSLQPGDPIEYMVRYLIQNRSDLRKHVVRCDCSTHAPLIAPRVCPLLSVARTRQARTQHSR